MNHRRSVAIPICLTVSALIPSTATAQVSGIVRDAVTHQPIVDAQVKVQATTISTRTAPDGSFSLPGAIGTDLWVVAAQKAYYEEPVRVTTPASGLVIDLEAVPQGTNPNYNFISPSACGVCHVDQFTQWTGSPMAKAGGNTWVYDIFDGTGTPGGMNGFVYTRDSVHRTHSPNSECASCHQPESWIKELFRALEPIDDLSINALHGVSCDVCHKVAHIDETKLNYPGIHPEAVTFTLPASGPNQVAYGVYGDVDFEEPYIMRASWQPQLSAEVCAACHQDKNDPDEDGDFEEENGVISEPTYFEWKDSPYGDPESPYYATCVGCHMPPFGAEYTVQGIMDPDPPARDPNTIRNHALLATGDMVGDAADLDLEVVVTGSGVEARVVVTNSSTGHWLPTGVTIRNMILHLRAWRVEDNLPLVHTGAQLVDALGGVGDPAQGYYAGQPGKLFAKVTHDANGVYPVAFTEATGVVYDNRLLPLAADTTAYTFALPEGGGTYAVQARLIYRRSFRALVDAKGWTETGHGAPLQDLEAPYFGQLMAKATWPNETIDVPLIDPSLRPEASLELGPNPTRGPLRVDFVLPHADHARVRVFDLNGRHLATLLNESRGAGRHGLQWDPRSNDGAPLPAGVYWCRLETAAGVGATRRFIVTH